ncbi:MAG: DUF5684 domain-containing protein [Chloroflexi bacterium]|nr:DUF5684 domain-containing protein [Chloroflexota bacterium]
MFSFLTTAQDVPFGMSFITGDVFREMGKTAFQGTLTPVILVVTALALYLYLCAVLMLIGKKVGCSEPGWMAWVPILNLYYFVKAGRYPGWYFFLMLISLVQTIVAIIVWLKILKMLNREWWWVILLFIPVINLIALGVLAFAGRD